ncbi:MAG TPA: M48 family metalloprotease [Pyrinomonadaceae bacterium]|jgi:predicted Zn-dependent protease
MLINHLSNSGWKIAAKQFFVIALTLICFLSIDVFAQDSKQDDKKKSEEQKKKEKATKAEEIASKQQAKRERRYQKIKIFALDKYQTDPSFKDAVDDRYRKVRQDQTREAYIINTRYSNGKLVTKDGDKIQFDNTLYENPLAQDYVNRVGQSLVPGNSTRLFAFKIIQDPVPQSRSLSTGTIYISTGYLSIIDNEAQLAYILSHEIAHIEKDHWFEDILVDVGTKPYMEKKEPWTMLFRTMAANSQSTILIAVANVLKAYGVDETFEWETVQEDEADLEAMKYMFARNYDVREIPKLYERMKTLTSDPRSQTGFIADPTRIKERLDIFNASSQQFIKADTTVGAADLKEKRDKNLALTGMRGIARMLSETLAPEILKKLDAGELIASSEEFQSVMALVKRDNGIRAFQFDMFEMSRDNLEDSIGIRSNDPSAYYYYGKVLKQTARNSSEISKALQNLTQAISMDQRQTIAEPYLFRAMLRLGARNPNEAPLIMQDLRTYVSIYQRENGGSLPANMEFIYDFMQDLGVLDYRATPAVNTTAAQNSVVGSRPTVGGGAVTTPPVKVEPATAPPAPKTRKGGKNP